MYYVFNVFCVYYGFHLSVLNTIPFIFLLFSCDNYIILYVLSCLMLTYNIQAYPVLYYTVQEKVL